MRSRERDPELEEDEPLRHQEPESTPELARTPDVRGMLALQRSAGNHAVARMIGQSRGRQIQRVMCGAISVTASGGLPTWDWGGETFHFNMKTIGAFHITNEQTREHYYFQVNDSTDQITGMFPNKQQLKELGKVERKETRKKFEELNSGHQLWFQTHYRTILHA
jgi:hypothetical protein